MIREFFAALLIGLIVLLVINYIIEYFESKEKEPLKSEKPTSSRS